ELEFGREAGDHAEVERQEIEEQRAIGLRGEGHHLPFSLVGHLSVDVMQIRRLSGPAWSVIDDLAGDLASGVVDERQRREEGSGKREEGTTEGVGLATLF